ncbi:hypothetical protein [Pseudomonas agarici]|uniref:hypothetical protein n=1 Tax=Pseudomonas agarici TaxID=46677 RepID=UPI00159FBC04|nr:hypothetical protein [Pseudomonas agarici]NWB92286.1 hypothetical protein [Pseudomonas agarici]
MSNRSIKKLCNLAEQMNALSVSAKHMSSSDQVESGLSDAGSRLYEEILKECAALAPPIKPAAQSQGEGEPVAWMYTEYSDTGAPYKPDFSQARWRIPLDYYKEQPLYLHPPAPSPIDPFGYWLSPKDQPGLGRFHRVTPNDADIDSESVMSYFDITPLYAQQPAPVAVVLPEREYPFDNYRDTQWHKGYVQGWNACLDEVARLNPSL